MKLPSVCTDLCLKQIFENATPSHNPRCRSVVKIARCELQFPLPVHVPDGSTLRNVTSDARFTGGRSRQLKKPLTL